MQMEEKPVRVRPDAAAGVAQDRRREALSHADEARPVDLHDQIVDLDPASKKERQRVAPSCCFWR